MSSKPLRIAAATLVWTALAGPAIAETRRALLVGIEEYGNPIDDLKGPANDVKAMSSILRTRFGFGDVVELLGKDATRDRILAELRRLMLERSRTGDEAVFYYSGHGSQTVNLLTEERDGRDETLVPSPFPKRTDIRDKELGRILEDAARRDVRVTAILDSCHSGSMGRGIATYVHPKRLEPDPGPPVSDPDRPDPKRAGALIVSAAQDDQIADVGKDANGAPGSLFTMALARALQEAPPDEAAADLFFRVAAILRHDLRPQEPAVDSGPDRLREPLFGRGAGAGAGRVAIASSGTDAATVVLEGGSALGLAVGTELTRRASDGKKLALRITEVDLARSRATVIEGELASVRPGQLFDVTRWTAPLGASLRIHVPAAVPLDRVRAAAARLAPLRASATVAWVGDPAELAPTHVVLARGDAWVLRFPDGREVALGRAPDARRVEKALALAGGLEGRAPPCDARPCVYARLPPVAGVVAALRGGAKKGEAIQRLGEDEAHYVLAARVTGDRVEHAWILAAPPSRREREAPRSMPLPARSKWLGMSGGAEARYVAGELDVALLRIARVRDWLALPSPPDPGTFPYHLVLKQTEADRVIGSEEVRRGQVVTVGEHYRLFLRADPGRLGRKDRTKRNTYVLVVDSTGAIQVMFPRGQLVGPTEATSPAVEDDQEWPALVPLGSAGFTVSCPAGRDTYVLVASRQALANLRDMEQGAIQKAGDEPALPDDVTGLERLLRSVGSASRAPGADARAATDPDWTVERLEVESRPGAAPCPP